MELSNKIRRFRFENDEMTQKQLAKFVGISRQTMNAIENCQHAPKIDVAIRIADVFGVLVDEMFAFDYEGKPERRPTAAAAAPTQPEHSTERVPHAEIGQTEPMQPVEPFGQFSKEKKPEREITLADLRKVIG